LSEGFAVKKGIYFLLFLFLLTGSVCYGQPQPVGEINRQQAIDKFFSNQSLDLIEGVWITTGRPEYEIAVMKNSFNIYPGYDYLGLIVSSDTSKWKLGEVKVLLKKTASNSILVGTWFMLDKSKEKVTFTIPSENVIKYWYSSGSANKGNLVRLYPSAKYSTETTGTGFFITKNLVVTNYHVVDSAKKIEVTYQGDTKATAAIVAKDPSNDLAILRVSGLENSVTPLALGSVNDVKEGSAVFTVGFPLSFELGTRCKVSEGIVNSTTGLNDDIRMFQISTPIQPGNSGGPLINSHGQVIGVVTASLDNKYFFLEKGIVPQNVNFAIKINYIHNLLSVLSEEVTLVDTMVDKVDAIQVMELSKKAIVFISAKK
jgi:Trypsin-like serine proteases, typically periplasmic, contain C-terminal PDZ domain